MGGVHETSKSAPAPRRRCKGGGDARPRRGAAAVRAAEGRADEGRQWKEGRGAEVRAGVGRRCSTSRKRDTSIVMEG